MFFIIFAAEIVSTTESVEQASTAETTSTTTTATTTDPDTVYTTESSLQTTLPGKILIFTEE